jgi:hypothetical protein
MYRAERSSHGHRLQISESLGLGIYTCTDDEVHINWLPLSDADRSRKRLFTDRVGTKVRYWKIGGIHSTAAIANYPHNNKNRSAPSCFTNRFHSACITAAASASNVAVSINQTVRERTDALRSSRKFTYAFKYICGSMHVRAHTADQLDPQQESRR